MLSRPCPLCGHRGYRLVKKEEEWEIIECLSCSFVFVKQVPEEQFLNLHYQHYLPTDNKRIKEWRILMLGIFLRSLDAIEICLGSSRGNLLDIGCGFGFFLELARKKGWSVYGVEPCVHARSYALSRGVNADSENLFTRTYEGKMFDVVTLFYVLEHLPDPIRYLREVNRILKPGGLLLVRLPHTTPIVKFLQAIRMPNKLYDVPSHLSDFSPRTIALALNRTGFDKICTFPGGATRPRPIMQRIISIGSGVLADILYSSSGKRILLPGVSKTTIARKSEEIDE